jgi:hypothetical protein
VTTATFSDPGGRSVYAQHAGLDEKAIAGVGRDAGGLRVEAQAPGSVGLHRGETDLLARTIFATRKTRGTGGGKIDFDLLTNGAGGSADRHRIVAGEIASPIVAVDFVERQRWRRIHVSDGNIGTGGDDGEVIITLDKDDAAIAGGGNGNAFINTVAEPV